MDNQQEDSSQLKSHEEIMRLFKDLEVVEAKVKNPTVFLKDQIEQDSIAQKIELSMHKPEESLEQQKPLEPSTEIPLNQDDSERRPFWRKKQKPGLESDEKKPIFSVLSDEQQTQQEQQTHQELDIATEVDQPAPQVEIPRSTFVLQVDAEGNLVGLPLKKPKPDKGKKARFSSGKKTLDETTGDTGDESTSGIKGTLKQIGSLFHRKESSDIESSGGIGDKIKGIFQRKSKE